MTTQEFIEKAIEGGYLSHLKKHKILEEYNPNKTSLSAINKYDVCVFFTLEEILLDPKSWEAVGKVEWSIKDCGMGIECFCDDHHDEELGIENAHMYFRSLPDHLISGGTIESYLETL